MKSMRSSLISRANPEINRPLGPGTRCDRVIAVMYSRWLGDVRAQELTLLEACA
jgi:hypothetical protein